MTCVDAAAARPRPTGGSRSRHASAGASRAPSRANSASARFRASPIDRPQSPDGRGDNHRHAIGERPVCIGEAYVRCPHDWRLGKLTVARDHVRFEGATIDLAIPCADVSRARMLCCAAAEHESGVFEIALRDGAWATAADVACTLRDATATADDTTAASARPSRRIWFKACDMVAAQEWAEIADDAAQAAEDAASGLVWDWFRIPASPAAIRYRGPCHHRDRHEGAGADNSLPPPPLPPQLPLQLPLVRAYAAKARAGCGPGTPRL